MPRSVTQLRAPEPCCPAPSWPSDAAPALGLSVPPELSAAGRPPEGPVAPFKSGLFSSLETVQFDLQLPGFVVLSI